jgi:4-alpha-glucanotransferase
MPNPIRFALVLHNHQPIGNFSHVFQQAFEESYRPFLDTFSRFDNLKISLHTSGSLMEWLDQEHPDYVDQLADLVAAGRIEIVGGPYYEPILAMLPSCDRIGQIRRYSDWLERRLGANVRGMWMPERIWEQSYTRDLVDAGMEYTVLDDYHFKKAGLTNDELYGHFATEDDGKVMSVFPGSERLRYLIPFQSPEDIVAHLAELSDKRPGSLAVFGDDGEKFGTWPGTFQHVYNDGWLERFFQALSDNQDWIQTSTMAEVVDTLPPVGKVYLPDCSYREMTEWSLPASQLTKYQSICHEMENDPHWEQISQFIQGGFWRNFKVKYPESNEMYTRMMSVSRRLQLATEAANRGEAIDADLLEEAQTELYRGQCNCSYWHGAFGGIYLPHLRNAVYEKLISAENLLDRATGRSGKWVEASAEDLNFDAKPEICLSNDRLAALVEPAAGGRLYELDVRSICHNLLATLTRRPEAYHQKVLAGAGGEHDECASIHDRVIFKQPDLDKRLDYDSYLRKSMLDIFFDEQVSLDDVASGKANLHGDFLHGHYEGRIRRNPDRIQIQLSRQGTVDDSTFKLTKGITLNAGSGKLEIAYMLENLPQDRSFHFGAEFNFAGLPSGADDRFYSDTDGNRLGQLGEKIDLTNTHGLGMTDQWLGIEIRMHMSRETDFWAYPVETVSQSEGGFELVHQSIAVVPHWQVRADAEGRWSVTFEIDLDTSMAEERSNHNSTVAAAF